MFRNKKIIVRLVLFCAAFAIAVTAFTRGVLQIGHRDSGYQDVGFTLEGNAALYDSGLHLLYYAEGGSSAIRHTVNEVQKVFTDVTLRYYQLLDARDTYEGVANIASLNAAPGEALRLDPELLAVLADALERTERGEGYSLYAGALYGEWNTLLYLDDAAEFDPLLNPEEAERLSAIAGAANREGALALDISAENSAATLTVSPEYAAFARENEIDAPALDLNLLHDAYLLELVARELVRQGYTEGYLYTDSGCSMMLRAPESEYALVGLMGDQVGEIAALAMPAPSAFCQFTAFPASGEKYGYYAVGDDDRTYLRHPYADASTGGFRDVLLTAWLASETESPVELEYGAVILNAQPDRAAVDACLSALPENMFAACTLQADAERVLYARQGAGSLAVSPDSGYRLEELP